MLPEVGKGDAFWLNESITKYFSSSPTLSRVVSLAGLGVLAGVVWLISRRYSADERSAVVPLGKVGVAGEMVFMLNLSGVLIFLGKAWVATYVWLIIPSAWLAVIVLSRRMKPAWSIGIGAGIILVSAKVYGFPFLDSLNLWGGIILSIYLAGGLLAKKIQPPETIEIPGRGKGKLTTDS